MASKEAFLPLATEESADLEVPMYSPEVPPTEFGMSSAHADATPVAGEQHLYCNYCCDTRRAVLVVNIVSIVINLVVLLVVNVGFNFIINNPDEVEKDMTEEEKANLEEALHSGYLEMVEAMTDAFLVLAMGMHACGIYGALKFKKWAVATAGSAYAISFILHLMGGSFFNVILAGALGYPHYFFMKEMNQGIMSDYNYHNVAHCCGGK
ncbi:MAG: hypothetical protein SGBAC_010069 [Bacillariaceae sp.]